MKLHRNVAFGIVSGLKRTIVDKKPASDVIKKLLKSNSKWGSRDRKVIAKVFYDVIRQKRLIQQALELDNNSSDHFFLRLIAGWMVMNGQKLPDWKEFININPKILFKNFLELINERKFKYSIPDWLDDLGVQAFGEKFWNKELEALNLPAKFIIRVNRTKISVKKLKDILYCEYQIKTEIKPNYPDALIFENHKPVLNLEEYKKGFFEIQDANSQAVCYWLNPTEGKYYIDSCAGAGGKSLHLANLTNNKAKILAIDINQSKLIELKNRAKRNKINSIDTFCIKESKDLESIKGNADGVLIDSPCSGIGVLKRNPALKWQLDPDIIYQITLNQQKIFQAYASLVKVNGCLIYATCSILPIENRYQVDNFLKSKLGSKFQFDRDKTYFSHQNGFDGFYCARLYRKM